MTIIHKPLPSAQRYAFLMAFQRSAGVWLPRDAATRIFDQCHTSERRVIHLPKPSHSSMLSARLREPEDDGELAGLGDLSLGGPI